ncbi:MAG: hypothetical protein WCO60_15425 [Verrucomicrobiota bacterium]
MSAIKTTGIGCFSAFILAAFPCSVQAEKHKPEHTPAKSQPAEAAKPDNKPSTRLSKFLDKHLNEVLAPSNAVGFKHPEQISELRESFADSLAKAEESQKPAYRAAIAVCAALSNAVDVRQQILPHIHIEASSAFDPARKKESLEREEYHDTRKDVSKMSSQSAAWETRAVELRKSILALYSQQREAERQGNFTP